MPSLRVVHLASLFVPIAAHADVHRCVADGKTVFQQHPCDAGDAPRAGQEPPAPRPATRSPPSALPAAAVASPPPPPPPPGSAELDPAGREALARQAHASLKARELGRLRTLMCVETNRNCARPEPKGVLDTFGKSPASDRSELGAVLVNESARVHFAGTEWDRDRGAADCTPALPFSVGLKREAAGRTCVSGVGVTASARSR